MNQILNSQGGQNGRGRYRLKSLLVCLLLLAGVVLGAAPQQAAAQEDEPAVRLRLRRDFGYGAGAQIQGRFSILADGPDDLQRVAFYLDEQLIGEDDEAPFRLQFNTSGYELGWHTLRAVGYTADGRELPSNAVQRQFVSAGSFSTIVVIVLLLVVGLRVVSHFITKRSGSGAEGSYGIYGGAVCPRCGRPFARHWWGINLVAMRLDRCPHCGKWHISRRASPEELQSAERFARELDGEQEPQAPQGDPQDDLRRRLEESRFD